MVQQAAACPHAVCCCYEGVCVPGHQLLLVMKRYSRSLAAIIVEEQQPGVWVVVVGLLWVSLSGAGWVYELWDAHAIPL